MEKLDNKLTAILDGLEETPELKFLPKDVWQLKARLTTALRQEIAYVAYDNKYKILRRMGVENKSRPQNECDLIVQILDKLIKDLQP